MKSFWTEIACSFCDDDHGRFVVAVCYSTDHSLGGKAREVGRNLTLAARARYRFYALWCAAIREGVTVHSRGAGDFCWTAGACCLYLLLRCTWRQRGFRRSFVPLRVGQANRHGSCKQRYGKSPHHSLFLPRLGGETLYEQRSCCRSINDAVNHAPMVFADFLPSRTS